MRSCIVGGIALKKAGERKFMVGRGLATFFIVRHICTWESVQVLHAFLEVVKFGEELLDSWSMESLLYGLE